MDWFLYDNGLLHEKVNHYATDSCVSVNNRYIKLIKIIEVDKDVKANKDWNTELRFKLYFVGNKAKRQISKWR